MDAPPPLIRPTARLIVLDPAGRVLLFKTEDDSIVDPADPSGGDQPRVFWVTPGGGVESGETFAQAARRELFEETGLGGIDPGPCLFEREKLLRHNGRDVLFRERYFAVRTHTPTISLDGFSDLERAVYREHRWWSREELVASGELFFPEELLYLVDAASRLRGA